MNEPCKTTSQDGAARYQGYEIKARWLIAFLVVLIVCAIAGNAILLKMFHRMASRVRAVDAPRSALDVPVPPATAEPRLQPNSQSNGLPAEDLASMRIAEDRILQQLGWQVDQATHQVRVPDALARQVVQRMQPTTRGAP